MSTLQVTPNKKQSSDCSQPLSVSVIIPAYNAADTIGAQLDALKAQCYNGAWEVIVVDNGSTDGTPSGVQRYQREMPNLRLLSATEKKTAGYARNTGAKAAKGDGFLFCDADDMVAPSWLSVLAKALDWHDLVVGLVEVQRLNPDAPQKYDNNGTSDPQVNFAVRDWM